MANERNMDNQRMGVAKPEESVHSAGMKPQEDIGPPVDAALDLAFREEGLVVLGISSTNTDPQAESRYKDWCARGELGDMQWLERHADRKYHPERIISGCQSILITGLPYAQAGAAGPGEGRVARYAWGRDYHKVLGKRLQRIAKALRCQYPDDDFRGYTDAVALDERHFAEGCGAGFLGRNTLLIHRLLGSWFVIGEILTTHAFAATSRPEGVHGACPAGCRKCMQTCPTGALYASGRMDARRCISYLTIEHKGSIPVELRSKIGDWVFGCDCCQEVCPFQVRAQATREKDFVVWRAGPGIALARLLQMDADAFFRAFAGSPVMRAGLRGMQRNACVAAGNVRDADSYAHLQRLAAGSDALLREHALWALAQYDCASGNTCA